MTVDKLTRRIGSARKQGDGDPRFLVLGGGHVGHTVAGSLADAGTVTFVDESDVVCRRASDAVDSTVCGDPAATSILERVDADAADAAVVATATDTKTHLAIQHLRTGFGVDTVVAGAVDPELADLIGDRADAVVTTPPIVADELLTALDRVAAPTVQW